LFAGVLSMVVMLWPASARAAEFDRTVPVARGTRLDVRLFGGAVVIQGGARDVVRVRATHYASDEIDVRAAGQDLQIRARVRGRTPHPIDFVIDVPAWMAVNVAGTYLDISVDGVAADIAADTVRGDVRVRGGVGTLALRSIEGEVVLNGGRGRAKLSSANNLIRVTGLVGDLQADTVSGSVKLADLTSKTVDVATVGGGIEWDGPFADGGRYQFVTHSGDIDVTVVSGTNARFVARAFSGTVRSLLDSSSTRTDTNPLTVVLGTGSAEVELESYNGTISLRK
jgi:hypothetical protein